MSLDAQGRVLLAALSVVLVLACEDVTSPTAPTVPAIKTYESIFINASWKGGATGPPVNLKAVGPGSFSGTSCPANSLILENHSTRYKAYFSFSREGLVFRNTCSQPAHLLVCVSAGSGGNFSEFPVCNTDARTTPSSRLAPIDMGPYSNDISSMRWAQTGLNLDLNIFYCGVGDVFSLGVVPGTNPTDCIQ